MYKQFKILLYWFSTFTFLFFIFFLGSHCIQKITSHRIYEPTLHTNQRIRTYVYWFVYCCIRIKKYKVYEPYFLAAQKRIYSKFYAKRCKIYLHAKNGDVQILNAFNRVNLLTTFLRTRENGKK